MILLLSKDHLISYSPSYLASSLFIYSHTILRCVRLESKPLDWENNCLPWGLFGQKLQRCLGLNLIPENKTV